MKNINLSKRSLIILTLVTAVLLAVMVWLIDVEAVIQTLQTADYRWLAVGSLFLFLGLAFFALRWRLLMGNKPPFSTTYFASSLANAANMLTPSRLGEPLRIVMLGQATEVTYTEATTAFAVERLMEQIMRVLWFGLAILVGVRLELSPVMVGTAVIGLILAFAVGGWAINHRETTLRVLPPQLARLPRLDEEQIRHSLGRTLDNLQAVARPKQQILVWTWSLLAWGMYTLFYVAVLVAIDYPAPDRLSAALAAMALSPPTATTMPGLYQASVVLPLSLLGFNTELLAAFSILVQVLEIVWFGLLAVLGLLRTGLSWKTILADEPEVAAEIDEEFRG